MIENQIDQQEVQDHIDEKRAEELAGVDIAEIQNFDQAKINEFTSAIETLHIMEKVDPDNLEDDDERIVFEIGGEHFAYDQQTYQDGMELEKAEELLHIEEKFLNMMAKEKELSGMTKEDIKNDQAMIDVSAELMGERQSLEVHRKSEQEYKEFNDSMTGNIETHNQWLEGLETEKRERYRGVNNLDQFSEKAKNCDTKEEVLELLAEKLNLKDETQPDFQDLKTKFGRLSQRKNLKIEELQNHAIDILIQKEVANRPVAEDLTFDTAQDLLQKTEISDETMQRNLSDEDLKNYLHDVHVGKKELFSTTATVEQKAEREDLLRGYKDKARGGVVEKMNEIDDTDWEPEIPYGDIHKFLLNDKPSFRELSPFLSREQFTAMYEAIHLTDGNAVLFDAEGRPLGGEGSQIIDNFLREAKATAKGNEYLAIEDDVLNKFDKGPLGEPVNKALAAYEKTISENKPRSWRERNTFFVLNAKVRERRQEKLDNYRDARDEKQQVEKFKESYLREQGAHVAKLWAFERDVKERIEGQGGLRDAETLLSENLDQRTRRQIRKVASKLRMEGLYLNEKVIKRLDGLTGCGELSDAFAEKGYETFDDFVAAKILDQAGWELPSKLGEQNEKYGTSLHDEKQNFVSEMNYESIRHGIENYTRNEVTAELRREVETELRRESLKNGHIVDNNAIEQRLTDKYPEAELDRIVEERVNNSFTELRNKFNNENAGGLLDFAANVGYIGKMVRRDLHDEIFGDRGKENINVTKVIDLLDGQRINDLHLHERDRRFELEIGRFAGRERWRQRWEALNRTVSGNPTFKRDEYRGLVDALEEGASFRSSVYQVSAIARARAYNAFGHMSVFGNTIKRNIVYTPFSWIAPYSEGTRQKIEDTLENQQRRYANRQVRWNRISNFGVPV